MLEIYFIHASIGKTDNHGEKLHLIANFFQSSLCINALPTHLFYFLADQHHFFPVGQCAGK